MLRFGRRRRILFCTVERDTFGRAIALIRVIATTNRNFPRRYGHKQAGVCLVSP